MKHLTATRRLGIRGDDAALHRVVIRRERTSPTGLSCGGGPGAVNKSLSSATGTPSDSVPLVLSEDARSSGSNACTRPVDSSSGISSIESINGVIRPRKGATSFGCKATKFPNSSVAK